MYQGNRGNTVVRFGYLHLLIAKDAAEVVRCLLNSTCAEAEMKRLRDTVTKVLQLPVFGMASFREFSTTFYQETVIISI